MRRRWHAGKNYIRDGDHNVISDISGFKYKSSDMRKLEGSQKGLLCYKSEWNPPQPQLRLHSKPDNMSVSNARPRQPDDFSSPPTKDDF